MRTRKYRGYTLEEAQAELELWKEAKRKAATGLSYTINGRQLTRQNLAQINVEIAFYTEAVEVLSTNRSGPTYVSAVVPR